MTTHTTISGIIGGSLTMRALALPRATEDAADLRSLCRRAIRERGAQAAVDVAERLGHKDVLESRDVADCARTWVESESGSWEVATCADDAIAALRYEDEPGWWECSVSCAVTGERESDTYYVAQEEPDCVDGGDHDWQEPVEVVGGIAENPGVWGHGGGVTMASCCMRCGCGRHIDTWAQCPLDGSQGHRITEYVEGEYVEDLREQARKIVPDTLGDDARSDGGGGYVAEAYGVALCAVEEWADSLRERLESTADADEVVDVSVSGGCVDVSVTSTSDDEE